MKLNKILDLFCRKSEKLIEMRRILAFILALLTLPLMAEPTRVFFDLSSTNFTMNPASNRIVTLQPLTPFVGNLLTYTSGPAGTFTASNLWVGDYAGQVRPKGVTAGLSFQIYVTSTNLGLVYATAITSVGSVQTYPTAGRTAWTVQASDQRYAQLAGISNLVSDIVESVGGVTVNTVTNIAQEEVRKATNDLYLSQISLRAYNTNAQFWSTGIPGTEHHITTGTNATFGSADGGRGWGIGTVENGAEDGISYEPNGQGDYLYSRKPIHVLGAIEASGGGTSNGVYFATVDDLGDKLNRAGDNAINLTNGSPTLATNAATATDGMVLVKRGNNLKLETISGDGTVSPGSNISTNGGMVALLSSLTNISDVSLILDGIPTWAEGKLFYDTNTHTLCYYDDQSDVTVNVAQEQHVRVVNKTGSTILNGKAVTINGAQGNRPTVVLAVSTNSAGSHTYGIIGVSTHDIANNQEGVITISGVVNGVDTRSYAAGSALFVSTNSGGITTNTPSDGFDIIKVGIALNSTVSGSILVIPQDAIHMEDVTGLTNTLNNYVKTNDARDFHFTGTIYLAGGSAGINLPDRPDYESILMLGTDGNVLDSSIAKTSIATLAQVTNAVVGMGAITNNNVGAVTLQNDLLVKQNLSVSNTMYVNAINSDFIWGGVNYGRILAIDETGGFYSTDAITNIAHKTETAALAYSTNLPSISAGANIAVTTNVTGGRTNYEVSLASTVTTNQGSLTAIQKGNGNRGTTNALAADVVNLFSGTPSSSVYLRGDGTLATPAGGGFSGSYGSLASFDSVEVTNQITSANVTSEWGRDCTNILFSGRLVLGPDIDDSDLDNAPVAQNGIKIRNLNDSHVTMLFESTAQKIQGIYFRQYTDTTSHTVRNSGKANGGIHLNGGGDMQIWAGQSLRIIDPADGADSGGDGTGHIPVAQFNVSGDHAFTNAGPIKAPSLEAINSITLNGDTRSNWPSASSPTYGKLYIGDVMTNGLSYYKAAFSNNNAIIIGNSGAQNSGTNQYQIYMHTTNYSSLSLACENTNGITLFTITAEGKTQILTSKGIVIRDVAGAEYFNAATNGETSVSSHLSGDIILNPASEHIVCNGYLSYVTDPVDDQDAATKIYVDTAVASDRNIKSGFEPVDAQTTLALARALPVTRWEFVPQVKKTARGFTTNTIAPGKHIGVMAQDFYAAFKTGNSDKKLDPRDSFGVALLSIQALADKNDALEKRVADLEKRLERLERK